jgi:translation elongation factor EF-G
MPVPIATITHEFLQPIRLVNQLASGGSYVAIFTLRLSPSPQEAEIRFSSEVSVPQVDQWVISSIEKGVREFVGQREREGTPIGYVSVVLVDIDLHPGDSKEAAFIRAGFMALSEAFQKHETSLAKN